jgi:hypothetical protein
MFSTSALAATVTPDQGQVFVNRGGGYKPVTQPVEAAVGDQVMVKPKSQAHVVFPDGCSVLVSVGMVFTIGPKSPCAQRGSHIETAAVLPPQQQAASGGGDALFLSVAGVTAGMVVLGSSDKAASP